MDDHNTAIVYSKSWCPELSHVVQRLSPQADCSKQSSHCTNLKTTTKLLPFKTLETRFLSANCSSYRESQFLEVYATFNGFFHECMFTRSKRRSISSYQNKSPHFIPRTAKESLIRKQKKAFTIFLLHLSCIFVM